MWFTIIYYHMFPRKIVLTNIKITRKSWSKYLNTLESILSFTLCFHKILWSSKCTSNMFILNFLDFLEVQVCLRSGTRVLCRSEVAKWFIFRSKWLFHNLSNCLHNQLIEVIAKLEISDQFSFGISKNHVFLPWDIS